LGYEKVWVCSDVYGLKRVADLAPRGIGQVLATEELEQIRDIRRVLAAVPLDGVPRACSGGDCMTRDGP